MYILFPKQGNPGTHQQHEDVEVPALQHLNCPQKWNFALEGIASFGCIHSPPARVEKNLVFFKKTTTYLGFLKRNKILFFFQRKQKKNILNCFCSIMQYHYFQNYLIITFYTYCGIQNWGKSKAPHLWFRKVLLVNSLRSVEAWQACAQQTEKKHSHTNSAVSRQVYVHALLVQHLQSVFFNIWFGMFQNQKKFRCREGRKIGENIPIVQRWRR